jgi:hypothetical protein
MVRSCGRGLHAESAAGEQGAAGGGGAAPASVAMGPGDLEAANSQVGGVCLKASSDVEAGMQPQAVPSSPDLLVRAGACTLQ